MEQQPQPQENNEPTQTIPEVSRRLFNTAQTLTQGAENLRTNASLESFENEEPVSQHPDQGMIARLEDASEKISMKAHALRKEEAEKNRHDAEVAETEKEHAAEDREADVEKPAQPAAAEAADMPEQAVEEIDTGLSSPEQLEKDLATITDIEILNQNLMTRQEAINELRTMQAKAQSAANYAQANHIDTVIAEQRRAIAVIQARIAEVQPRGSMFGALKRWFGRGSGKDAA